MKFAILLPALASLAAAAMDAILLASDNLLKGDSQNPSYKGGVDIYSYAISHAINVAVTSSGATASQPSFSTLSFTKRSDKSTAGWNWYSITGQRVGTLTVATVKYDSSGKGKVFQQLYLENIYVTSFETTFDGDEISERINVTFTKISHSTAVVNTAGDTTNYLSSTWDLAAGKGTAPASRAAPL